MSLQVESSRSKAECSVFPINQKSETVPIKKQKDVLTSRQSITYFVSHLLIQLFDLITAFFDSFFRAFLAFAFFLEGFFEDFDLLLFELECVFRFFVPL